MNALEQAIEKALQSQGDTQKANKAYLELIKANLIIPIEKYSDDDAPQVLYLNHEKNTFMPVFSNQQYLDDWAVEIKDRIHLLKVSGVDLLKNTGENISICLNIGSPFYKEFNPSEIARMRSMIIKLFGET